jgi:hypothetical protein
MREVWKMEQSVTKQVIITGAVCRKDFTKCEKGFKCFVLEDTTGVFVRCPFLQLNAKMVSEETVIEQNNCDHEWEAVQTPPDPLTTKCCTVSKCHKCGVENYGWTTVSTGVHRLGPTTFDIKKE